MILREAVIEDLDAIIALLADDPLGAGREAQGAPAYRTAFQAMAAQAGNHLLVADGPDGAVIGCLQLTLIPGLSRSGALRAQIEGVRVHPDHRGTGLGKAMLRTAIERAAHAGAALVQLTSDNARPEAHRFYEALGFTASHTGFKLML